MGIASKQILSDLGVTSTIDDPLANSSDAPVIIGGGELIRTVGDPFYDRFRRRGPNILNAAGVWTNADDLDYLNEYQFVSARSSIEVEALRKWVPSAELLPCTTTLLQSDHFEIPGIEPGEPVVGIHMVPHSLRLIENLIPLINAIPYKKVFIPFTHYNSDASFMKNLPFDKSNSVMLDTLDPLQLHSVISQMNYVIVSSLHASIFAYSQNVPFASVHQKKAAFYFEDRGLGDHLVSDDTSLKSMIERLDADRFDFTESIDKDKLQVRAAFEMYAGKLGPVSANSAPVQAHSRPVALASPVRDVILLDQARHVVGDRDLALAYQETRRLAAMEHLLRERKLVAEREAALVSLTEKLNSAENSLEYYRSAWPRRLLRTSRRFARATLNRLNTSRR